jgi:HEAT repeat protein
MLWLITALALGVDPKEAAMKLNDSSRTIEERVKAAEALGAAGDKQGLEPLLRGLEVRDDHLRAAVVTALGKVGGAAALYKLALTTYEPIPTRKLALAGVRALKPKDAGTALVGLLSAPEPEIRADTALMLAVIGAKDARGALIKALDDESKDVRYYAAEALVSAGGEDSLAAVKARQAKETDAVVKDALAQAARRLAK